MQMRRRVMGLAAAGGVVWLVALAGPRFLCAAEADPYRQRRERMVREQIEEPRDGRDPVTAEAVLDAMRTVPRHSFVPPEWVKSAYEDTPLPIGHGQTISQPYMVAKMTELLQLAAGDIVLEVGTGSGYQAAVLSLLVKQVYTVEIVGELGEQAKERLKRLEYANATVKIGDGYYGWEEHAPFDAVIVTAAASHIPPPLIEQMKRDSRMVIPVGQVYGTQHLMLVEKRKDGKVVKRNIMPVRFVPLTGGH